MDPMFYRPEVVMDNKTGE